MYGLREDIDLTYFIGKGLIELGVGQFGFGLNFGDNISISVEAGGFSLNNTRYKNQQESQKGHLLHILLGKKIIDAKHGKEAGDLQLDFEGNNQLILHDDSEWYESYTFWDPKGLVVV